MGLLGLDHVQLAIPVEGEAAARSFYRDLLGLAEVEKPEPLRSRGGCWLHGPGIALHLGVEDPFTPALKAHPAFLAEDLDGLAERLRAAGRPVTWDDALAGVRRFYTSDPFGNRIELIAAADGGLSASPAAEMRDPLPEG